MKQNYKIFKSNPVFSISGQLLVLQNLFFGLGLGLHFESSQVASLIYQGELEVWEFGWTWPGEPLAGGLVVVAPFFCGNRKMGGNLLNRVKRDSNLGLVRLDPLVLWHSNWSFWPWTTHVEYLYKPWFLFRRLQSVRHLSFPAPDAFFRFLDEINSRWQSREDRQKEEGGGILDSLIFHFGQPTSKISSVSGWKTSFPTDVSTTTALGSGILDSISHAKTLAMHDYNLALNWMIDGISISILRWACVFCKFKC